MCDTLHTVETRSTSWLCSWQPGTWYGGTCSGVLLATETRGYFLTVVAVLLGILLWWDLRFAMRSPVAQTTHTSFHGRRRLGSSTKHKKPSAHPTAAAEADGLVVNHLSVHEGGSQPELHQAVLSGDVDRVKALISSGDFRVGDFLLVNEQRRDGATPLLLAVQTQRFDICVELLRTEADPSIAANGWRWECSAVSSPALRLQTCATPLMVAVMTTIKTGTHVRDDPIIRALIYCGGLAGANLSADADDELQRLALPALSLEDDPIEEWLGFDPIRIVKIRSDDAAAIAAAAARHPSRHDKIEPYLAVLANLLYKLSTDPLGLIEDYRLRQGQYLDLSSPFGVAIALSHQVAYFLTADHQGTDLQVLRTQAAELVWRLTSPCQHEFPDAQALRFIQLTADSFSSSSSPRDLMKELRDQCLKTERILIEGPDEGRI